MNRPEIIKSLYDNYNSYDDLKLASALLKYIHDNECCHIDCYNKYYRTRINIIKQILTSRGVY